MSSEADPQPNSQIRRYTTGGWIVPALAAIKILFHLLTATRYGYFVDEFYYYSCSEHLRWGYIDHPPLVAGLMWVATHTFGSSLLGMRVIPALLGGATVWLAALTAREFGGGRFAETLAAVCVLCAPAYMMVFHFFSMNAVEPVLWTACVLLAARAIGRRQPKYWLAFGACCGLGMENKYSIVFLIVGIVIGLLVSKSRAALLTVQFWLGILIGGIIFLPNYLWLSHNSFPFLQWRSVMAQRGDLLRVPAGLFLEHMLLWTGATCVVAVAGAAFLLFGKQVRAYQFAGVAAVVVVAALIGLEGKTAYAAPIYAVLFAGGAVLWERMLTTQAPRAAMLGFLAVTGAVLAPCFVPILPLDEVVAYQAHIPLPLPIQTEKYAKRNKLPQMFSLETGWDQMVAEIADQYHRLPPAEQSKTGILTFHYGTAGAVDLIGPKYGLPKAISTAMSWHDWGPREYTGESLILVGYMFPPAYCNRYEDAPPLVNSYMYDGVGLKGDLIHVCHGLRFDLQKQWEGLPWY